MVTKIVFPPPPNSHTNFNLTLELITLFVNLVFKISALGVISQIHENASLGRRGERSTDEINITYNCLDYPKNAQLHDYLSTSDLREHKLELSNSGTISILCKTSNKNKYASFL